LWQAYSAHHHQEEEGLPEEGLPEEGLVEERLPEEGLLEEAAVAKKDPTVVVAVVAAVS
jgi:hypothetical protein